MSRDSPLGVRRLRATDTRSRALPTAALLWIVAGVGYLAAEAIAASAFPGYSYATNYISDLGIPQTVSSEGRGVGSPLHAVMNAAFVIHGVLFVGAALLAARAISAGRRRWFVVPATVHGVGIALVGVVHSGEANADNGLAVFHGAGAGMAIVGGNVAVIVAGLGLRRAGVLRGLGALSVVLGVVGIVGLATLMIDTGTTSFDLLPKGVEERVAVNTITVWEIVVGVATLVRAPFAGRERPGSSFG